MVSEVRSAVGNGDYSFFTQRGIDREVITPVLADRLLKDWRNAIVMKRNNTEKAFWRRFAEEIEVFRNLRPNVLRIAISESFYECNAIFLLGGLDSAVLLSGTTMPADQAASIVANADRESAPRDSAS